MTKEERQKLYTVRWFLREKWGEASAKEEVLELLSEIIDPEATHEARPSVSGMGGKLLWCPFARADFPKAITRGSYKDGYPKGAIVHFTAGRRNGLESGMKYQSDQGYLYFLIDEFGNIGQNFSLDSWGYHAGKSSYEGLNGSVSDELVGIEVQSAGKLTKSGSSYKTWFGETVPKSEIRTISKKSSNQESGSYQKYTDAQEQALSTLLLWLYQNNPDVFSFDYVLGHDEVSPGRKNDPGAALSMTMPKYRKYLHDLAK